MRLRCYQPQPSVQGLLGGALFVAALSSVACKAKGLLAVSLPPVYTKWVPLISNLLTYNLQFIRYGQCFIQET